MRQRVSRTLVAGLLAVPLLIAGSESAMAGGGREPATISPTTSFGGATHAVRPANLPVNTSDGGSAEGGGDLELLHQNPPWPAGVAGYIIFSTEGTLRTADDVIFNETTPLVAVRVFYTDNNFATDPNNPGSDFFVRIYDDDGTNTLPGDPEIFVSGPHNPGDGILQIDLYDTDGFGADSALGATFNFGSEFFIANAGIKHWYGMTGTPPAGATQIGTLESNLPAASFEPMAQDGGGGWAPVDVEEPPGSGVDVLIDMGLELLGFAPVGGTTVLNLSGITGNNCHVRVTPTTAPITDCAGGVCDTDPIFGADCFSDMCPPENPNCSFPGLDANAMAQILALGFANLPAVCNPDVISAQAAGPYLIVTTTGGTKPKLCLSVNGNAVGIIGGPNDCEENGCGITYKIGRDLGLPSMLAGTDIFATPADDCALPLNDDAGTWAEISAAGAMFDRDGLAPAGNVDQRMRFAGVARNFTIDDSDTAVRRLEDIRFDQCSGDFSRPGALPRDFAPDGLVDATDIAAFGPCNGQTEPFAGDCGLLDFNGDDTINEADLFVLQCLAASGNSSECCPDNLDLPQGASRIVATEVTRLHLRACDYLEVTRTGSLWPENWVVDYYLSAQDPSVGADEVGVCATSGDELGGANDVMANADSIGLLSEGDPRQVGGAIGNTQTCDIAPFWPGDHDADVYSFSVAFPSSVSLRADALANVDCTCAAAQNGVVSLWLFDDRGILVGQADSAGASDPEISASLDPGAYFVMVAAAGQIQPPLPAGIPGNPNCAVAFAPEVDGGGTDPTGCYDLHLAVAPSSNLAVTQETADGGSLDSRILVQPLITYQRLCDPGHAVLVDTGDLGIDASVLEASGHWVNNLTLGDVIAGDDGFIPGVRDDGGSQSAEDIQHADLQAGLAAHRVTPARSRACDTIFTNCAASQAPDAGQTLGGVGAVTSTNQNFPLAENFTVGAEAEVSSVTFWVTPADIVGPDHEFIVRVLGDTPDDPGEVCGSIPNEADVITEGTVGSPFVGEDAMPDIDQITVNLATPFTAVPGTTYWLELSLQTDISPGAQVFFVTSLDGDGSFFHDVIPAAGGEGTCDATVDGDGWDCNVVADDGGTPDCDESDADGDRRGDDPDTEDVEEQNIAFCVSTQEATVFTKEMPSDVACGSWRQATGEIIWSQPFAVRGDGTVGFFSDFSFGTGGGNQGADSFTFFEAATVTDVHWRGTYTANTPDPAADDFTLEFWSDGDNVPDGLLRFFTPANSEIERVSSTLSGDPGRQVFSYSYTLPAAPPFEVGANQTVWLSVINNTAGQDFNWTFAIGGGGNSDGRAALRAGLDNNPGWITLPTSGDPATDFSFDITVDGNTKIVCGDSVDCTTAGSTASGLGYRFDPLLATINGFQTKSGDGASDGNRWRNVGAPWKMYQEVDGGGAGQDQLPTLFDGIGGISTAELDCLRENVPGAATVAAVFAGLAAYDTDPATNGISVTGELHRLCDGALAERVNPTEALSQRLTVKGICWTNGSATFLTNAGVPAVPELVHGCGQDGETAPRSGLVDPRQESTDGSTLNRGYQSARLVFTQPVVKCDGSPIDGSSFALSETGGGTVPTITGATAVGDTVTVNWDRPITLQEWTTITAVDVCNGAGQAVPNNGDQGPGVNETDRVDIGFLPCDVNQSSDVSPFDLLRFRQIVNEVFVPCEPVLHLIDMNHNLNTDPFDLLVFRQLVQGIGPATKVWNGESMNNTQP